MLSFWQRRPALGVAVFALAVHLAFLAVLPAEMQRNESADYLDFYRPVAERLLDGRGLQDQEGRVAMRYPPGYPVIIAATVAMSRALPGGEALWMQGLVALSVALTAGLLVVLAQRLSGSTPVAVVAGFGWALYPPQLWMTKQPNSEIPFMVLMLAGLLAWYRAVGTPAGSARSAGAWALAAGVLLGTATLIRPIGLLLAPVVAVASLLVPRRGGLVGESSGAGSPRRRWGLAIVLIASHVLTLAPWVVFVHRETGVWIPVSSGGRLSVLDGLTLGVEEDEASPDLSADVLALTHDVQAHRAEIRGPSSAAAFLLRRAQDDPWPVLELLALKAGRSWYGTESVRHERYLLMIQIPALLLASLGLWRFARRRPGAALGIAATVAYFWGMTFLVLSILRYMVPAMALLMVPIAWLVLEGGTALRPKLFARLIGEFP